MKLWDSNVAERLFDPRPALHEPITISILAAIVLALAIAQGIILWAERTQRFSTATRQELQQRLRSWVFLIIAIAVPIVLGAAYTVVAVWVLSLLCYREFARTVGVFRYPVVSVVVVLCVTLLAFASIDHFDRLYFATGSLGVAVLIVSCVLQDQPKGFIQRTALGIMGLMLFGYSLGYLGLLTNCPLYRSLLLSTILAVEANDIFAYCCGKSFGGPKLLPNTSPGKTVAGCLGAVFLTTLLVAGLFHFIFVGTALDRWWLLLPLGALVSVVGQLGDLTLSSIKRDLGMKDFGRLIPGHGGILDRFDSLVLVPPVVYHFVSLVLGPLGMEQPARIISGG